MMNFSRKLSLALSLSSLLLADSARAETPVFEFDSSLPESLAEEKSQRAAELWREWEAKLSTPTPGGHVRVSFSQNLSAPSGGPLLGKTDPTQIQLNQKVTSLNFSSVFAHELAHAFYFKACPQAQASAFFAESFAIWLSGDEKRLLHENSKEREPFHLESKAREYLLGYLHKGSISLSFHHSAQSQALARVLANAKQSPLRNQALKELFQNSLKTCSPADTDLAQLLLAPESQEADLSVESFLFMDGLSGEVLSEKGNVRSSFPVASLLKPYLLSELLQLRLPRESSPIQEWYCPQNSGRRLWTWQEALKRSCNGFFLSHPEPSQSDWAGWRKPLELLGVKVQSSNATLTLSQAIGLTPAVEASPLSIATVYRYLSQKNPDILEAIRDTAKTGTLENLPDSPWFVSQGIALKSGTVRNGKLQPEHGWIVAIGPRVQETGWPSFISVIHQKGSSPQLLLSRLRANLEANLSPAHLTRVQILGLIPQSSLSFSCRGAWLVGNSLQPGSSKTAADLKEGERLSCMDGPVTAKFLNQQGTWFERDYFGTLFVSSPPTPSPQEEATETTTARQQRARLGSSFILETSEKYYLLQSLASEFSNGRKETLKALALALKANSRSPQSSGDSRHLHRPICDTTHCQVFGAHTKPLSASKKKELYQLIDEIQGEILVPVKSMAQTWLHFSLGGDTPWEERRASKEIKTALQLPQNLFQWKKKSDLITLHLGDNGRGVVLKKKCESIRNSLKLPSCPDEAILNQDRKTWVFKGRGEGHGLGLDLAKAELLSTEGRSYKDILGLFYPEFVVKKDTGVEAH